MKKILALTLTSLLIIGGVGTAVSATAETDNLPTTQAEAAIVQNNLYLVPGTYVAGGEKIENGISSGATKLTVDESAKIFTENAYLCTLSVGDELPVPTSTRVDKDGKAYAFNGWWTIVDATVTYFDKVPELSENTFLYADWRADLSQRKDPVEVDDSTIAKPMHYMSIQRAATGETDILSLRVSGTNDLNADKLIYGAPVEIYNDWFELNPGDIITVYATGLGGSEESQLVPLEGAGQKITLEVGASGNDTGNYLSVYSATSMRYRTILSTRNFRIYIKFYSGGRNMAVYMEPMD